MGNERAPQPTLTGARVRLRPWRADDVDAVFDACQDAEIQRWTQVPVPYLREHAEGFVTDIAASTWAEGGALFAVEPRDGGALLASIGLFPPTDGYAGAGYWTVAAHRGKGLAADARWVRTGWAFDQVGLRRVELAVDAANAGSLGVARSAGFSIEGTVRQRFLHRGEPSDVVLHARIAPDGG